jgi:sortase A
MKLKNSLGWIEAGLYVGGAAMIALFLYLRMDSGQQAQEGIEAFHASVEAARSSTAADETGKLSDPVHDPWVPPPDQELWAAQRIEDYENSLRQYSDPPHAILTIDRLGIQVPVYNGTDDFNLNRGVGRIKGTARVGEVGNLGIAGHRDGFFRPLKDIQEGDVMTLLTHSGEETYHVSSITITDPSDVSVLESTSDKTITLVTCYPFYYVGHAPERFIVKATVRHLLATN